MKLDQETRLDKDGQEEEVSIETIQQGEHVLVRPGQRIPIDGLDIKGSSAIDQQLVTGELLPRDVEKGDEVIGGSLNVNGSLVIEVTSVGEDTFLSKVAQQVAEARVFKPGILRFDRILNMYVPTIFSLPVAGGIVWSLGSWLFTGEPDWIVLVLRYWVYW